MEIKKYILILAFIPTLLWAQDTVVVVGGIQHEGLFPTDMSEVPQQPEWAKITHLSNTYLDLGVRWERNRADEQFRGLEVRNFHPSGSPCDILMMALFITGLR